MELNNLQTLICHKTQQTKPLLLSLDCSTLPLIHSCVRMLLQWISQISFPRLVHINTSSSYSLFPVLFLPSFSPSSCNRTFEHARQLIHSESPVLTITMHLYPRPISKEFAYAQIDSRRFEISQRFIWCLKQPYLFPAFTLQARHVHAHFECPGTLCPLHSQFLIILSVKEASSTIFLSLGYDSTWNWTPVSQVFSEHSTHLTKYTNIKRS